MKYLYKTLFGFAVSCLAAKILSIEKSLLQNVLPSTTSPQTSPLLINATGGWGRGDEADHRWVGLSARQEEEWMLTARRMVDYKRQKGWKDVAVPACFKF